MCSSLCWLSSFPPVAARWGGREGRACFHLCTAVDRLSGAAPSCDLVWCEEEISGFLRKSGSNFGWVCADSGQCVLLCVSAGVLFHLLPADSMEGEGEGEV